MMINIFFQKPVKTSIGKNDILLDTYAIHHQRCLRLPNILWLEIIKYLPERDLIVLMLTSHILRINAINSLKSRTQLSLTPGGFFNTRNALYRILSQKINEKTAVGIDSALMEPYYQQQVFNKIPISLLLKWLEHEPRILGDLVNYMLNIAQQRHPVVGNRQYSMQDVSNKKNKDIEGRMLKYIFEHTSELLNILNKKGIREVQYYVERHCIFTQTDQWLKDTKTGPIDFWFP